MNGFIIQQQNNSNKQRKKQYCVTLLQYHFVRMYHNLISNSMVACSHNKCLKFTKEIKLFKGQLIA